MTWTTLLAIGAATVAILYARKVQAEQDAAAKRAFLDGYEEGFETGERSAAAHLCGVVRPVRTRRDVNLRHGTDAP